MVAEYSISEAERPPAVVLAATVREEGVLARAVPGGPRGGAEQVLEAATEEASATAGSATSTSAEGS